MRYLLVVILYLAPAIWAIADAAQHPEERPFGLAKPLWVLLVVIAPLVGAGAWIYLRIRERLARPRPRRSAPDDDPEYLRWIEERRRRGEI